MNGDQSSILDPRSSVPAPPLPLPRVPVAVRAGTLADVPFMDSLQKLHARQVGWMPRQQLEAKVAMGQVLIAEGESGRWGEGETRSGAAVSPSPVLALPHSSAPVGYCIASDRYMKREDVGIVYQMNVAPGRQRGLVGATLLKAVFERAAYGCRLFCCWCAQDIEANRFWEAMGFVPLAFRAGGRGRNSDGGSKRRSDAGCGGAASSPFVAPSLRRSAPSPRIHIFWQRRIRAGDVTTPWWYPSQTGGGSIREDRLVLPIPPGVHWSEAKPVVLSGGESLEFGGQSSGTVKRLEGRGQRSGKAGAGGSAGRALAVPDRQSEVGNRQSEPAAIATGGLRFGPPPAPASAKPAAPAAKARRKPAAKNDPKLVAAARELRDRYLERVNGDGAAGAGLALPVPGGKYDVGRAVAGDQAVAAIVVEAAGPTPLLADARAA